MAYCFGLPCIPHTAAAAAAARPTCMSNHSTAAVSEASSRSRRDEV